MHLQLGASSSQVLYVLTPVQQLQRYALQAVSEAAERALVRGPLSTQTPQGIGRALTRL